MMWDRKLKKRTKGRVLEAGLVEACIYGSVTLALTEGNRTESPDSKSPPNKIPLNHLGLGVRVRFWGYGKCWGSG